jgi:small subunit ribosomal protein S1
VNTVVDNPEAKVVPDSDGMLLEINGQIVPNYDATLHPFEEGEVVTGHVVRIDQDEVLVDIGYKSEGVIPANELSIRKSVDPHEEVQLGEEVDALVLTKEDQDGRLIISKKRARFEKAWRRIEAAAESGEPVEGTVIEVVKGGLIIDLGVRGFLPASLVDIRRVPNLDEYMGTQIECKVIELNRSRNNVVLSRRAVLEEERKEVRQQILDRLEPGLVVEGQISNIVDFGAFVDLDGIDGLIHISELSWSHVNHPSQILEIGDTVKVKVLDIDRDRQRISLGLKQTQEDPWQRIVSTYNIGDELAGTVTKVVTFGAFVEILDGVEGLVHISELAAHHVENPREVVQPGDEIRVKILEIDSERRRLSLSAKRIEDQILPLHPIVLSDEDRLADDGDPQDVAGAEQPVFDDAAPAESVDEVEAEAASEASELAPRSRRQRRSQPTPRSFQMSWPSLPPRTRKTHRLSPPATPEPTPPFVGLTGSIGAGKSTALAALVRLGAVGLRRCVFRVLGGRLGHDIWNDLGVG